MELGIILPNSGKLAEAGAMLRIAEHAEALGFDALWTSDHLVVPTNSTSRAQEVHLLIGHLVCELVEEWLAPPRDPSEVTATEDTWD